MISLSLDCAEDEAEILSAELWDQGATGIQEEPLPGGRSRLKAWFDEPGDLLVRFARWSPRLEIQEDHDWEAESRNAWQPFAVGEKLWLTPPWDESPAPPGRLRVTVHPGLALGTGAHPATRLCLHALERHVTPADAVLDLGTGTGILASAALLLGALGATGCDMEEDSVHIARENTLTDGISVRLFAGSTRALRDACCDILVANINSVTHESLAREYARLSRRMLIVSGYTERERETVENALFGRSWTLVEQLVEDTWLCHVLMRA